MQQRTAARGFKLAPQLIGPAQQRHVRGMLEIAEADDAGEAVRGAPVVPGREALEPKHAQAAARQMIERRAPHRARSDDNHVMCHGRPALALLDWVAACSKGHPNTWFSTRVIPGLRAQRGEPGSHTHGPGLWVPGSPRCARSPGMTADGEATSGFRFGGKCSIRSNDGA